MISHNPKQLSDMCDGRPRWKMAAYVEAVGRVLCHCTPEEDIEAIVERLPSKILMGIVMRTVAVMRKTRRYWEVMREDFSMEYAFSVEEAITTTAVDMGALDAIDHPPCVLPAELPVDLWDSEVRPDMSAYPADAVMLPFGLPPGPALKIRRDAKDARCNFEKMTEGLLDGVVYPGSPFVVCGGMVLQSLRTDVHIQSSDVDVFVVGIKTARAATIALERAVRRISQNFESKFGGGDSSRQLLVLTRNALTIVDSVRQVKIQFILRLYQNVTQILHRFDLGACMLAFDGRTFRATPRGVYALRHGVNLADPMNLTHASRGAKYTDRGFAYVVPTWKECTEAAEDLASAAAADDAVLDAALRRGGLQQAIAWRAGSQRVQKKEESTNGVDMESNTLYEYLRSPHLLVQDDNLLADFRRRFGYRFPTEFVVPSEGGGLPPAMYGELVHGDRWKVDRPADRTSTGAAATATATADCALLFYNLPGAPAS